MSIYKERVINEVSSQFCVKPEEIDLNTEFVDGLGADSLDMTEMCMALEDEFSIEIDDEAWEKVVSVQNAILLIEGMLDGKS